MQLHGMFCISYTKLSAISVLSFYYTNFSETPQCIFCYFILLELGEWKIHAGNSTNLETSEYTI